MQPDRDWQVEQYHGGRRRRRLISPWRLRLVVLVAASMFVPSIAQAELAPTPVEAGELYFTIGVSVRTFKSDPMRMVRMYLDDDFAGTGTITLNHPRGFLLNYSLDESTVWMPEVNLGYAFKKSPLKGVLGPIMRVHFRARWHRRGTKAGVASAFPKPNAALLTNPADGVVSYRNERIHMQPISGDATLANGDDAGYFHGFTLNNSEMRYDATLAETDFMVYFDQPIGDWHFTRGLGVALNWQSSDWRMHLGSSSFEAAFPANGPVNWDYEFGVKTIYFGPRTGFSIGWEPIDAVSFFVAGGFSAMLAISTIDGRESGFCLGACDPNAGTASNGVSRLSATDLDFGYDANGEIGASIDLKLLRLSAQVGLFANNMAATPREGDRDPWEVQLTKQWGFYGRALATVSF